MRHKLGYRKLSAINTAQQDLNTIELIENKLWIGEGGAGKNPEVAAYFTVNSRSSQTFLAVQVIHPVIKDVQSIKANNIRQ